MAKAQSDKQGEQKTGETVVEAQTVIANDVQFEAAVFPESSVDSAFAAREAEAPLVGQELVNVEPAAADSDVLNVTKASLDGPVPAAAVQKLVGSEVHGTFDGLLKQVSSPPDEAAEVATGEAILSAMDRINPPEEEEEVVAPSEPAPSKAPWKETHRVVTPDSVYIVMVVDMGTTDHERAFAWTHAEYDAAGIAPALNRQDGSWWLNGEPFTGNVHSLAPAAEDRHTHRRG